MKRVVAILTLLLVVASICLAQEEPIPPKRSKAAKIGGLFGYTPGWLFLDTAPLNNFILPANGAALKNSGVYMSGIGGSAFIMFIPNVRVGGLGMSGKTSSSSLDGFGVRRDVELNVGFGGVTFEYVVGIQERLNVVFGTMLGGGGIDVTLRQDNGGALTWGNEWGNFGNPAPNQGNRTTKLTGSYFVLVPSVSVEYGILGWLGVRLGASYVGMVAPSWEVDDKYELLGVPSNISGRGLMINAGVFVGTF